MRRISVLVLLMTVLSGTPPVLAQARFLPHGHSGLGLAWVDHSSDTVESLATTTWGLTYTHRGRWDMGLQYARANDRESEDSGLSAFGTYVLVPASGPGAMGWEIQGRFAAATKYDQRPYLPTYFPQDSYHRFERFYRLGVRWYGKPAGNIMWGLGAYARFLQKQVRDDGDVVLKGYDTFGFGGQGDLEFRLAKFITVVGSYGLAQHEVRSNAWTAIWTLALGVQFDLTGGQ